MSLSETLKSVNLLGSGEGPKRAGNEPQKPSTLNPKS